MALPLLTLPERKRWRAEVVRNWIEAAGLAGCVCFSCGNASRALREAGLYVVEIAPGAALQAGRWWQAQEIRRAWPHLLDATSGHLPAPLMVEVAIRLQGELGPLPAGASYAVPTGSGETLVCLAMAYPANHFVPRYGDSAGTAYEANAPLNALVRALGRARAE